MGSDLSVMPRLVGLCGPKRCGKDTAALALINHFDYRRAPFAGGLKAMLEAMLAHQGVDAVTIERMIEGDLKEVESIHFGGRTPRHCMQTLGTEWGRGLITHDLWVQVWNRRTASLTRAVITDVRFDNEAEMIRDQGGLIIQITRPGLAPANDNHVSEKKISPHLVDLFLTNEFDTAADWEAHVQRVFAAHLSRAA